MENEKISVIIPIYKVEKYLDKCIASVCAQTYQNLEIILVNDGSPDRCGEICDLWKEKDSRILVIHKENGGLSSARNAGLDRATGDYIGFVDSDDSIQPEMYTDLMTAMKETGADIAMCAYQAEGEETPVHELYPMLPQGVTSLEELLAIQYENPRNGGSIEVVWDKLFPKKIIEGLRFRENQITEDTAFLNDYMSRVKTVAVIEKENYCYLKRSTSIMWSGFSTQKLVHFYFLLERIENCKKLQFREECIRTNALLAMKEGVDDWLRVARFKMLPKEEEKKFYKDVVAAIKDYRHYGSLKQRFYWTFFCCFPRTLKTGYTVYKKLRGR